MTGFAERVALHRMSYGHAWIIPRWKLVLTYTIAALLIPVVVPLPAAPLLARILPETLRIPTS